MKLRYDNLKQLLNDSCPRGYRVVSPTIQVHLIDKNKIEYYFIDFNDVYGHAIIQYPHKSRYLFEFKQITIDELVKVEAVEYEGYKNTPVSIESLMYFSLIF
ncbi:MAG: hypothetical protein K0Q49_2613 [Haloplasmataceae bacterium]|jgi:hypothetical protein|nr:hypothetical protein [Haloplasmataceae bacterium]